MTSAIQESLLVTGGAGFIGSNLVDVLLARGYRVVVLDDLSTGDASRVPRTARFVHGDIRDSNLDSLLTEERVAAIFHLAAQVDVRKSVADPIADASINVLGTLNVGVAAVKAGVRHVLFASSGGAIYGEPQGKWADEDHPLNPCSPYGVAKLAGEKYLEAIAMESSLKVTILRYANVYGPRQDGRGEAGVIGIFLNRLLSGQDAVIYGDGEQTRDFIHVADVVTANLLALEKGVIGTFNTGTGIETSIKELYALTAAACGVEKAPVFAPKKPGEQKRSVLDPAELRSVLGMTQFVGLADGLTATAEWFRQHLEFLAGKAAAAEVETGNGRSGNEENGGAAGSPSPQSRGVS
ncbi:MAG: NAD-dependent epimerase/dehydratase family protein [Thermoanaerobaculia bacterium]|nr:UDP-glucose 4-epimerase [Thermoanaerobaculia bacterium]MCK6684906.1 NAD-dependent epimerase/dehydratase family protein [Thermoanaerobaculia bacterium]